MAKLNLSITLLALSIIISSFTPIQSATFTLTNQCTYPVWAGLLSGAGTPPLPTTSFPLEPSLSNSISIPTSWSGRIWGRTKCSTDDTGKFTCVTGDCGSGAVECNGSGAAPPATLAEFTLNGADGMDFYDVSLVDGYNLPIMIVPKGAYGGNCNVTGCLVDLNINCPAELRLASAGDGSESVACRSACEAFGDPMYCCSGAYSTPQTCNPTSYSEYFKTACPTAYSYAYDDGTSTFTCMSADYAVTFCPTPANSRKTTGGNQSAESSGSGSLANAFGVSSVTVIAFILARLWRL
ncbi:thaumatin-like protein 1b [Bidens hawaiensis]|uniref:thaumatin-like protein 1b n=1 Tax=Bidens hawaiensis TaxID=980011 RepID=UPI00404A7F46